jgi:hypothetical protein
MQHSHRQYNCLSGTYCTGVLLEELSKGILNPYSCNRNAPWTILFGGYPSSQLGVAVPIAGLVLVRFSYLISSHLSHGRNPVRFGLINIASASSDGR